MEEYKFLLRVNCVTYNHARFIEDAMNGFCIQKTSFPYVCIIVDDASTDGEQDVIKHYLETNFEINNHSAVCKEETEDYFMHFAQHNNNRNCFFAVFLLKYNHYRANKTKRVYLDGSYHTKYVAMCEGDDYWVSPDKLQKQVSFLESHPQYVMTCSRAGLFSEQKNRIIGENYCYRHSRDISVKDVIYRGGNFINTCSILYRKEVMDNIPEYWLKCKVGDSPLEIACVLKGRAWYFNDLLCVYRTDNPLSWMGSQNWSKGGSDPIRREVMESQIKMFCGFSNDYPQYKALFKNKIADHINRGVPSRYESRATVIAHLNVFSRYIKMYSNRWKLDLFIRKSRIPFIRGLYEKVFRSQFYAKKKYY